MYSEVMTVNSYARSESKQFYDEIKQINMKISVNDKESTK